MRLIVFVGSVLFLGILTFCSCSEEVDFSGMVKIRPILNVPSNYPDIRSAMAAAAAGDTILVADGIYSGEGNRDLDFNGVPLVIISQNGPGVTIIDCGGTELEPHFGFSLRRGEHQAVIDGFTIQGAFNSTGAAISLHGSSPLITNCIFRKNRASVSGGAIRCKGSSPTIANCTFVDNASMAGGALFLIAASAPTVVRCIIIGSLEGAAIYSVDVSSRPTISCTNIYGNIGGDWTTKIAEQLGSNGNMSMDPMFCDPANGDYYLQTMSQCTAENSMCGELVGALGAGCE